MDYNEMPLGLGVAITSNRAAMDRFVDMSDNEKKDFIERSRSAMSEKEIDRLVNSLVEEEEEPHFDLDEAKNLFDGPSIG